MYIISLNAAQGVSLGRDAGGGKDSSPVRCGCSESQRGAPELCLAKRQSVHVAVLDMFLLGQSLSAAPSLSKPQGPDEDVNWSGQPHSRSEEQGCGIKSAGWSARRAREAHAWVSLAGSMKSHFKAKKRLFPLVVLEKPFFHSGWPLVL